METQHRVRVIATAVCLLLAKSTFAGEPLAVTETVSSIANNWKDAFLSIDVDGPSSAGDATVDQALAINYEAATPGYVSYLQVSSHGDLTLTRDPKNLVTSQGEVSYNVKPPLGTEEVIVLFSSAPLDSLFPQGGKTRNFGADAMSAKVLVRQIADMQASGIKIAVRRYKYLVTTPPGGTEYTTRGIEFTINNARQSKASGSGDARIPSHIQFEFDSDKLTDQGKRDLDQFGDVMSRKVRDGAVVLEGHTDAMGPDDYNMTLSWRRAEAVKQYLSDSFGISKERLKADGKGKEGPIMPNDSDADRSQNRRVDIIIKSPASDGGH